MLSGADIRLRLIDQGPNKRDTWDTANYARPKVLFPLAASILLLPLTSGLTAGTREVVQRHIYMCVCLYPPHTYYKREDSFTVLVSTFECTLATAWPTRPPAINA